MTKKKRNVEKMGSYWLIALIFFLILVLVFVIVRPSFTGDAGISLGAVKQHGLTSTQRISIDAATVQGLCVGKATTSIAAKLTDAVTRYQGGWQGAIKDALGVPSTELPDIYGALAYVAGALDDAKSTQCLNQIGLKNCDRKCQNCKAWTGDMLMAFYRASACRVSDCEYWNSKVRYVGSGVDCTAELGCVFSNYPKTGQLGGCYIYRK